jgi:DNA-binding GntR family transcriptional regulator
VANSGGERPDAVGVLADRLAATLVQHEPGWRLPRPSALARRYDVRQAQVEQAVRQLADRHLIRQLPDGSLYRASPAHYLIPVQGITQLGAQVDPMGNEVTRRDRKVSWRRVPEDIGRALSVGPPEPVCAVVRCHWAVNGETAAISTTYLTKDAASKAGPTGALNAGDVGDLPLRTSRAHRDGQRHPAAAMVPAAVNVEVSLPPSSLARGLRLAPGQSAALVTVRYDDATSGLPAALLVAALRTDLFRIVVTAPAAGPEP